jgi:hypothetical protein
MIREGGDLGSPTPAAAPPSADLGQLRQHPNRRCPRGGSTRLEMLPLSGGLVQSGGHGGGEGGAGMRRRVGEAGGVSLQRMEEATSRVDVYASTSSVV